MGPLFLRLRLGGIFSLLLLLAALFGASGAGRAGGYYINYSPRIDGVLLSGFDYSILHPEAEVDLAPSRAAGHKALAYLSVVEVARDASYQTRFKQSGVPVLTGNSEWASDVVDITHPAWIPFVLKLAEEAAAKGYSGFFLDTVDSWQLLARAFPSREAEFRHAIMRLIRELKRANPHKLVVANRGLDLLQSLEGAVDGVMVESLFKSFRKEGPRTVYRNVPPEESEALSRSLEKARAMKLKVFVLDYCDPSDLEGARETSRRIEELGHMAFVGTPELDGVMLAPWHESPHGVLTVYGNLQGDDIEKIMWPVDSGIGRTTQIALEWLGLEPEWLNIHTDPLPARLPHHIRAVILDPYLAIPANREQEFGNWLISQKRQGAKIIFMGDFPYFESKLAEALKREFGWGGTTRPVAGVSRVEIAGKSELMGWEVPVRVHPTKFADLQAPKSAEVWLSLRAKDRQGAAVGFDPVFIAEWGGAILSPYLFFRRSDYTHFWLADPFAFFAKALALPPQPKPDATTRYGRRLFYTHIDGDGFRHKSSVRPGKLSSEIVIEEIIKPLPYPITCSIIESEIRGLITDQAPGDEVRLTALAREMFALGHVEAASHTFSHPFYWMPNDITSANYDHQALQLKPPHDKVSFRNDLEIPGSVNFINTQLLPAGKKVELLLWSGNCRPGPEALAMVRKLGIESMNGGDTTISLRRKSITKVAPRSTRWGREVQIFAANQNENVYRELLLEDLTSKSFPAEAGFMELLDTFDRTETPRRLKPLNIYYHFYIADTTPGYEPLKAAYRYVDKRDVNAVTAAQYAGIARDAGMTRVLARSDREFLVLNRGKCATVRLDSTELLPDLAASKGVVGWIETNGSLYVHTDGSPRCRLSLSPSPSGHLRVEASTAWLENIRLEPDRLEFNAADFRPIKLVLAGLPPGGRARATINGEPADHVADTGGRLELLLPKEAKVSIVSQR